MTSKRKGSSDSSGNDGDPSPSPPVAETDQTGTRTPASAPHHQPLVPGTVLRSERATKIKVEANLGRDLGIFALLIAGLVVMSLSLGGVGNVDEATLKKRLEKAKADGASTLRMWPGQRMKAGYSEWSTWMGQMLKDLDYMPEEEERCKLYVADSSIPAGVGVGDADENLKLLEGFGAGPGYGYGLFAGRTIREGEVVVDAGVQLTVESHQVPQHAMIIKPHPTASNVQFVANEQHYIALRNIRPGEEIFVDMPSSESVYFSFFKHLPTRESYRLAQEILVNELDGLTKKKNSSPRGSSTKDKIKPARSQRSRGPNNKPKRRENTEKIDEKSLRLIRKIVARFDYLASLLLPETSAKLEVAKTFGIDVAVLNNRTMPQVYRQGQCFDGVEPTRVSVDEKTKGALLTRNVTKGEVIMSIPLLAVEKAGTSANHACFKIHDDERPTSSFLCPLSKVGAIIRYTELDASVISERGDNCEGCPNAAYNWSSWNPSHSLVRELGVPKASKDFPFALSLDIVAAQDLEEGTEIILQSNSLPKASVIAPEGVEEGISSEL